MIEVSGLPCGRVVTILAGLREPEPDVVGVGRLLEIRQVTTHTRRRGPLVLAAHVAGRAIETGVGSRQSKASHFQMIKGGAKPGRDLVTLLTTGRESRGRVVRRRRLLIGRGVARVTLKRQALKLANGRSLVTTVALQ